jgi:Asp-tRNA(Asn)/Glu-tRNA(Gln) amidotransferase A subunit family amidase
LALLALRQSQAPRLSMTPARRQRTKPSSPDQRYVSRSVSDRQRITTPSRSRLPRASNTPSMKRSCAPGRRFPAILYNSSDYVQAQRERRVMLAEMAPVYAKYDVLLAPTASGPAPRLDTWCTIRFWQHASLMTPFNVTGGPALAQCMGFTTEGFAALAADRWPPLR